MVEFDSVAQAIAAHDSPAYQEALKALGDGIDRDLGIVEGLAEQAVGPHHPLVATSLNNLASLYLTQGQYAQAEPFYKRSLAIMEKTFGPDRPSVATSLENMAALYRKTGRKKEAEALENRVAVIRAVKRSP